MESLLFEKSWGPRTFTNNKIYNFLKRWYNISDAEKHGILKKQFIYLSFFITEEHIHIIKRKSSLNSLLLEDFSVQIKEKTWVLRKGNHCNLYTDKKRNHISKFWGPLFEFNNTQISLLVKIEVNYWCPMYMQSEKHFQYVFKWMLLSTFEIKHIK